MIFETDKQTMTDLNLLGRYKANSVYSLFCSTATSGGEILLEQMFNSPLVDIDAINRRVEEFRWFRTHDVKFPVTTEQSEQAEHYLFSKGYAVGSKITDILKFKISEAIGGDIRLDLWRKQIETTAHFLILIREYLERLDESVFDTPIGDTIREMKSILTCRSFDQIYRHDWSVRLSLSDIFKFDKIMLSELNGKLIDLMSAVYRLDVDTVVGKVARDSNFCFAEAVTFNGTVIKIKSLYHPCLKEAVSNDLEVTGENNVFFLTGANMAGKSTLMKSYGIAVYMAHMGFPIAASAMTFTLQQGLYTSINVSDNLDMGYSHFYAEVLRVKRIAIEVSKNKSLVVIFDELFKGTNVKDAYDATLAVTAALADRSNCALMISTHIIEVAEELMNKCENITFEYLPTIMKGSVPFYTYKLEKGFTNDKHGMIIIENEHVIEIILGKK